MKVAIGTPNYGFSLVDIDNAIKATGWEITELYIPMIAPSYRGVMALVKNYAEANNIPIQWTTNDNSPSIVRPIVQQTQGVIIFNDGEPNKRMRFLSDFAHEYGKRVYIYHKEENDDEDSI